MIEMIIFWCTLFATILCALVNGKLEPFVDFQIGATAALFGCFLLRRAMTAGKEASGA